MTKPADLFMVFDVESVGLHGEAFAVGYVVVDRAGRELADGEYSCPSVGCGGTEAGREWVAANCPLIHETHVTAGAVADAFWRDWQRWRDRGALLAADCAWPVEGRFLNSVVDRARPVTRGGRDWAESKLEWDGPYPLIDVASVRLAAGLDPLATVDRRTDELPAHNPLADARQSARLLIEALDACQHKYMVLHPLPAGVQGVRSAE